MGGSYSNEYKEKPRAGISRAELTGVETRELVDPKVAAELAVQAPLAPNQLTKLEKYQGRRMSIDRHQEMYFVTRNRRLTMSEIVMPFAVTA